MTLYEQPIRILFVFAWLVVGGEETEVRLLARHLDRSRYRLDVVACFHKPNMPHQTHEQLQELGVEVDTTPYHLSFEDTVAYLANKIPSYDIVISCQNVADIYPALERLALLADVGHPYARARRHLDALRCELVEAGRLRPWQQRPQCRADVEPPPGDDST